MTRFTSEQIHTLIGQLLDVSPAERGGWLDERLPNDAATRDQLLAAVVNGVDAGAQRSGHAIAFPLPRAGSRGGALTGSIGRYEITGFLGRGGMGEVYLALDPKVKRTIAIKLLYEDIDTEELRIR